MTASLQPGRIFLSRLARGSDLWDSLTAFCVGNNIRLATVEAVGAVEKAVFGYYRQQDRQYDTLTINKPLEIVSMLGNVSLLDGQPFLHAHVSFGDEKGQVWGGHLFKGTIVFSVEYKITELVGGGRSRQPDADTGLPLWGI